MVLRCFSWALGCLMPIYFQGNLVLQTKRFGLTLLLSFGLFSPDGGGRTGFECWHTGLLKTKLK